MANFAVVIYNKKQPFSNLKLKPFCLTHPRHTYAPLFMLLTMSKNRFLNLFLQFVFFSVFVLFPVRILLDIILVLLI